MDTSRLKRKINPMPADIEERLNKENLMDAYKRRPLTSKMIIWAGY